MASVKSVKIFDVPNLGGNDPVTVIEVGLSYAGHTSIPFTKLPESHQKALRAYIEGEK